MIGLTIGVNLFPGEINLIIRAMDTLISDYEGTSDLPPAEISLLRELSKYLTRQLNNH